MNNYETPKSKVYAQRISKECGICPVCEGKVSNWAISKPTIRPNKIKCNCCSNFIKITYPKSALIPIQIAGFLVGGLCSYISFQLATFFIGLDGENITDLIQVFFILIVLTMSISMLFLGFMEAWIFKNKYPFKEW